MERKVRRTITDVLNYETGEEINANAFFKRPLDEITIFRSELQKAIQGYREPLFTCYYCKQLIRIRGGIHSSGRRKSEAFHFAHLKDSDECHIKTKNKFSKEEVERIKYNGAKESILHQTLKAQIAEVLNRNCISKREASKIEVEKIIKNKVSSEWKKPDINAYFFDRRIALELQLSTTWLDVITRRQHFYEEQSTYIFWVFHVFNPNDEARKLTFNDVIYTNNQNAFVFDEEAYEKSLQVNDLVLKCWYKVYSRDEEKLLEGWSFSWVSLSDLTFDESRYKIYYHDSDEQKKQVNKEISDFRASLRESERLRILQEEEREQRQWELESEIESLKNKIEKLRTEKDKDQEGKKGAAVAISICKDALVKIDDYLEKTLRWLVHGGHFKPFHHDQAIIESITKQFGQELTEAGSSLEKLRREQKDLRERISGIERSNKITLSGKTYTCLNSESHWSYITANYKDIQIIHKSATNDLFAGNEIRSISNQFELDQLRYSRSMLFIVDLDPLLRQTKEDLLKIEKSIVEIEGEIEEVRPKVKLALERHFNDRVSSLETELANYREKLAETSTDLYNAESKLYTLEHELLVS